MLPAIGIHEVILELDDLIFATRIFELDVLISVPIFDLGVLIFAVRVFELDVLIFTQPFFELDILIFSLSFELGVSIAKVPNFPVNAVFGVG